MIGQPMRIKICGIRDLPTARAVVQAGADYLGLVFVPGSPRQVTPEAARAIVRALPPTVQPVGLFVDAPLAQVRQTATDVGLTIVQLHGRETPDFVRNLAPLTVIKSINFDPDSFSREVQPWLNPPPNLRALLIDAPAQGKLTGGSGHAFDWPALHAALDALQTKTLPPIMLAGGLNPKNVAQAVAAVQPWGVDVSSGVESARGIKDAGLIHAFSRAVRGQP